MATKKTTKKTTSSGGLKITSTGFSDSSGSYNTSGQKVSNGSSSNASTPAPKITTGSPKVSTPSRYVGGSGTPAPTSEIAGYDTGGNPFSFGGTPSRYTNPIGQTVPQLPGATSYNGIPISSKPTLGTVNEKKIREETRKSMQASIDAINANYTNLISQEKVQGEDRSGQTRALNARSGTIGSDFGQAAQEKTTSYNKQQVQYLADQQNAQIQQVMNNIEDRAEARIQSAKNDALNQYNIDNDNYKEERTAAMDDFKALAGAGVDLNTLDPNVKAALFKQAGYEEGMGDLIYNAMKPKPKQIDYQSVNVGNGKVLFYGVDPQTGELKQQLVETGMPDDWSMTIAPDGTVLGFNKNTGETQLLSGQGQFAKPVDAASEFLDNPKKQAAFNQIVSKYNSSPLIAASDRTLVLKNTIDQVRSDPSNGAQQLNLSYAYIQALDTYQSAVREGELGIVNSIDSKVGQFQNYIQQMQNGQIVRPEVAKQIADAAEKLVKTISEGARQKEQVFASQARVNGIEQAWNDFRSGFSANYDDPTSDSDLSNLWDNSGGGGTPVDINRATASGGLRFDSVGNTSASGNQVKGSIQTLAKLPLVSTTTPSTPKNVSSLLTQKYPEGYNGGQCGDFARKLANSFGVNYPPLGNSLGEKMNAVKNHGTSLSKAKIGSVLVTKENPTYGHVATIIGKNEKGWVVVESNFKQSNKVSYGRTIPFNSKYLVGVINPSRA